MAPDVREREPVRHVARGLRTGDQRRAPTLVARHHARARRGAGAPVRPARRADCRGVARDLQRHRGSALPVGAGRRPRLNFYNTGPIYEKLISMGIDPTQIMREWGGQMAATSPRTQTPPNLRNAGILLTTGEAAGSHAVDLRTLAGAREHPRLRHDGRTSEAANASGTAKPARTPGPRPTPTARTCKATSPRRP